MKTKTLTAIVILAGALFLLFTPAPSTAIPMVIDTITYSMNQSGGTLPAATYGTAVVDLFDNGTATITVNTINSTLIPYALGDGGILAVNPSGTFSVVGFTSGLTNVGAEHVDGIGDFKLVFNDGDGFSNPYSSVFVTLSGTWASAAAVLMSGLPITEGTPPNRVTYEYMVGAHFGIYNPTTQNYPNTGWIGSGGVKVPEPGILILLGIAMSAVGVVSRFVRKI